MCICLYSSLFYNLISCIFVFLFIGITLLSLNFKFEKFLLKFNGKRRPRLVKVLCLLDLSPKQASLCEGYLLMEEVLTALNDMVKGKAPRSDGFPWNFVLHFGTFLAGISLKC